MTTTIVGRNLKLTKPIKDLVYKRSAKLKRKYFRDREDYRINAILRVENNDHIADIIVYKNGKTFKKSSATDNMYKSINEAFDTIDRDIRKHKERLRDKKIRQRQEEREEDWSELIEEDDEVVSTVI